MRERQKKKKGRTWAEAAKTVFYASLPSFVVVVSLERSHLYNCVYEFMTCYSRDVACSARGPVLTVRHLEQRCH